MNAVTNTYSKPTDKQINYAASLAARKGYRSLGEAEKACFGKCKVGGLNREAMSRLIDWLAAK